MTVKAVKKTESKLLLINGLEVRVLPGSPNFPRKNQVSKHSRHLGGFRFNLVFPCWTPFATFIGIVASALLTDPGNAIRRDDRAAEGSASAHRYGQRGSSIARPNTKHKPTL